MITMQEAMAKARKEVETWSFPGLSDRVKRENFIRERALRLQFEATFNEWLLIRGTETSDGETDEEGNARCDREWELAESILVTPAVREWLVFLKFEVINYCITKHGEASYMELLALTALDGIKADILRFGIMREEKLEKELSAATRAA